MGAANTGGYDQVLAQRLAEHSTPVSVLHDRIRQLEELNKVLAAEVDAQRPLVDAACKWSDDYDDGADDDLLLTEVTEYYGRKAAYQVSKLK